MIHNDVRNKIDSLKNEGYYFLFEQDKKVMKLLKEYGIKIKKDQP